MKKRAKKAFNRNLKLILGVVLIVVVAFGGLLMLISGNEEREAVDTGTTQTEEKKERKKAEKNDHPGVSDQALAIYNARVDNVGDTAAVAQLTEAMDVRKNVAPYLVTLKLSDKSNTIVIDYDIVVNANEEAKFNEEATYIAQQLLALVVDLDKVKWNYTLNTTENKEKKASQSLTLEEAGKNLGADLKDYAETPEMVQTLMNNQKGIV